MVEGDLVFSVVVSDIVILFSIYPSSAKQTGSFTLLFAHNFPATNAVAHQLVLSGLAVAYFPSRHQKLAKVSFNLFSGLAVSSQLLLLLNCLILNLLSLILVQHDFLNALNKVTYK